MPLDMNLVYNQNNQTFDLAFQDGQIVLEQTSNSVVKHIWFGQGRISRDLQSARQKRGGFIGDVMNNQLSFSRAWIYYKQGTNTQQERLLMRDSVFTALNVNPEIQRLKNLGNSINVEVSSINSNTVQGTVKIGLNVNQFII